MPQRIALRMAFIDVGPLMFGPTSDVIQFFSRSVRESSFFAKSQLTLQTWVMLLHFWSRQNPVSDTAECAKVALNTAVDVYQWLREVCSTRLINDGPVMLGGHGVIVQIDESLFKHKPKVVYVLNKMTDLNMYLYCCSTTAVDVLTMNSGCLGWWTPLTPLP